VLAGLPHHRCDASVCGEVLVGHEPRTVVADLGEELGGAYTTTADSEVTIVPSG
jgi:hypothetical protein